MPKNPKYDVALPLYGVNLVPMDAQNAAIIKFEYLGSASDLEAVERGAKKAKSVSLSLSAAQIDDLVRILGNAAADLRDEKTSE